MAVAPTGMFSLPFQYMRNLIAQSSAFQIWAGHAGNATGAADHIYYDVFPARSGSGPNIPLAIISERPDDDAATDFDEEARGHFTGIINLVVTFMGDLDRDNPLEDELMTFRNTMGAIVQDMLQLANIGQAGDLGPVLTGRVASRSSVETSHPDDYENEDDLDDFIVMQLVWQAEGPV